MFSKINKIWKEHGFEIILGFCIAFILIYGLWQKIKGTQGTWSKKYYSLHPISNNVKTNNDQYTKNKKESKGEIECRRVIQNLFKRPFPKARPNFLRNPVTGGNFNLELDCFNADLKIAVEYNGIQHYKYVPYFHKNKEAFLNQKYRDEMKRQKCRENGIILIEVPHTVKIENIKGFIENELRIKGI